MISYISKQIAVLYLGHIVEIGPKDSILRSPKHPYTTALLSTAPKINLDDKRQIEKKIILSGELPNPANPPSGCVFRTRCPIAKEKCVNEFPFITTIGNQQVSCHYPGELK